MIYIYKEAYRTRNKTTVCLFQKSSALLSPSWVVPVLLHKEDLPSHFVWVCGQHVLVSICEGGHRGCRGQGCSAKGIRAPMDFFQAVPNYSPFRIAVLPLQQGALPKCFSLMCSMCLQLSFISLPVGKNIIESFFLKPAWLCVQPVQGSFQNSYWWLHWLFLF